MTYQEWERMYYEPRWIYPAALIIGVVDFFLFCCL